MTTAEVVIDSIAAGGDGVGRTDGVVVFVPRAARGDRLRVELETRKRFARGTIRELIEPSPDRAAFRVATAVWRRLPMPVANRVGPLLSRHLP